MRIAFVRLAMPSWVEILMRWDLTADRLEIQLVAIRALFKPSVAPLVWATFQGS
jgi:hypothetical protein